MTVPAPGAGSQPLANTGVGAGKASAESTAAARPAGRSQGPALVLEASTRRVGVALLGPDGEPWGQVVAPHEARGTALLASAAESLLAARGLRTADMLGVIVGTGPGSYTGTRAAIAFGRALAWAAGLRLAGVPSVAGAALGELRRRPDVQRVVVLIDARRGESYRADYARAPTVASGVPLFESRAPCLVTGAEALPLATFVEEPGISVLREPHPDAYDVGAVGRERLLSGGDSPEAVLPLYLKRSHAEIVFDERVGSQGLGGD